MAKNSELGLTISLRMRTVSRANKELAIPRHVRAVLVDEDVVLVDARRGLFFAIPPSRVRAFSALMGGTEQGMAVPASDVAEVQQELLDEGLLRRTGGVISSRKSAHGLTLHVPEIAPAAESNSVVGSLSSASRSDRVILLVSFVIVWSFLRLASLHRLLTLMRFLKRHTVRAASVEETNSLVGALPQSVVRMFISTACLESSLATMLATLLRRRSLTWHLGVRTRPFGAHAWVECGGRRFEEGEPIASTMTPVLSV